MIVALFRPLAIYNKNIGIFIYYIYSWSNYYSDKTRKAAQPHTYSASYEKK